MEWETGSWKLELEIGKLLTCPRVPTHPPFLPARAAGDCENVGPRVPLPSCPPALPGIAKTPVPPQAYDRGSGSSLGLALFSFNSARKSGELFSANNGKLISPCCRHSRLDFKVESFKLAVGSRSGSSWLGVFCPAAWPLAAERPDVPDGWAAIWSDRFFIMVEYRWFDGMGNRDYDMHGLGKPACGSVLELPFAMA